MKQRVFTCRNCGYSVPVSDDLAGLIFHYGNDGRSMLICPACGSTTIQRTYDGGYTGEFLVIRSHIKNNRKKV